ncbi:MAG TPA: sigma 54-interacting transcriptional regulator [Nitrospiria bacterium]|nr:sigma 54-interacting transcriptional regulator [Nitrospiria bacterium]
MTGAPHTILIVDDDTDLLRLLTMRLSSAGYRVTSAESAEKALVQLAVIIPDVVITDLRMTGMDGMRLFETIHQAHPALPVIIMTAHGSIPHAVKAMEHGVFNYLTKPLDGKVLISLVQKALQVSAHRPRSDSGEQDLAWRKELITRSPLMEEVLHQARLIAASETSVFIHGETGTGKELLARAIHLASPRSRKPFTAVNCSVIPEQLFESELFGYRKGAFTGAVRSNQGLFQATHEGTLFLDEIGDMPILFQPKLLRALQEKRVRSIGATESTPTDVRIVSASHRDLEQEMRAGKFREDLYYRLNVMTLEVPPLSKRREDIPLLAAHFLARMAKENAKEIAGFSPEAMELLLAAPWPGNVRHLQNVVEHAVVLSTGPVISAAMIQAALRDRPQPLQSLDEARDCFEQSYLIQLLQMTQGNVKQAAGLAKRNRTEFYKLLTRHKLIPSLFRSASDG